MTSLPPGVLPAPHPAQGWTAPGFEYVARVFASQLASGEEVGAGFTVYHRGTCVVDLWGGQADVASQRPWGSDTRLVLFSVTKALAAMALHLLAEDALLVWDAPVADYWPGFAAAGKGRITVRTLVNHRGGLAALDAPVRLRDCLEPGRSQRVLRALERQAPAWEPEQGQGYHALTFGLYVDELFRRIAGEDMGAFLRRRLLEPLRSDVWLGTPPAYDLLFATLYPPPTLWRLRQMVRAMSVDPDSTEARVARDLPKKGSLTRRAFSRPSAGAGGLAEYNALPVRRSCFPSASATGSAHGLARAFLPFALGGEVEGKRYFSEASLEPLMRRQGWSERDSVLQKPLGWSQGFLKEERHLFCPNPSSFGHSGMGGALGWCDPSQGVALGYVMNRMDWRVRSPRCVALCRALYECEPLR